MFICVWRWIIAYTIHIWIHMRTSNMTHIWMHMHILHMYSYVFICVSYMHMYSYVYGDAWLHTRYTYECICVCVSWHTYEYTCIYYICIHMYSNVYRICICIQCVSWCNHVCEVSFLFVWSVFSICVKCLFYLCHVFICVLWCNHACEVAWPCVARIHMCVLFFTYVCVVM